jgi:hypothetical protein
LSYPALQNFHPATPETYNAPSTEETCLISRHDEHF